MKTELSQTSEKYLRAILAVEQEKRVARVKDIAERVGVHKSTVTGALRRLARDGWVDYEPYEAATLTEKGLRAARVIAGQQRVISNFLQNVLDVEQKIADSTASDIRHSVNERVLGRLVCFLAFIELSSEEVRDCLEEFREFSRERLSEKSCEEWVKEYIQEMEEQDSSVQQQ